MYFSKSKSLRSDTPKTCNGEMLHKCLDAQNLRSAYCLESVKKMHTTPTVAGLQLLICFCLKSPFVTVMSKCLDILSVSQ